MDIVHIYMYTCTKSPTTALQAADQGVQDTQTSNTNQPRYMYMGVVINPDILLYA
jgi:hypothetical protein